VTGPISLKRDDWGTALFPTKINLWF